MTKKTIEDHRAFLPDSEMVDILQSNVDHRIDMVNRAKEYVRLNEIKLKEAEDKLEKYKKGELYKQQ